MQHLIDEMEGDRNNIKLNLHLINLFNLVN